MGRALWVSWAVAFAAASGGVGSAAAMPMDSAADLGGTVTVAITGKGDVTGPGISCNETGGPDCAEFYADTTQQECYPERKPPCITVHVSPTVELTAAADRSGYAYDGWTGCGSVAGRACTLTVTENAAVAARFLDITNPSVAGLSPSGGVHRGTFTLSANASDNSGAVTRVEFRVRGAVVANDSTAPYSANFVSNLVQDGSAQWTATAFDGANRSGSVTATITIDNSAPTLSVTSGPNGDTFGLGGTQAWTFSTGDATSGVSSVQCSVVPAGESPSYGACSSSTSHSVSGRPAGSHTFWVRVTDGGGLQTVATRSFSIDGDPPETTITGGPGEGSSQTDTSATFTFAADEPGSTFACRVYQAALTPGPFGSCSGTSTHSADNFSPGVYAFEVRATDPYGNGDPSPAKRTFTVSQVRNLTVSKSGVGTGTVQSSPAGIACGGDCTEAFADGTTVMLTAEPTPNSVFVGWHGQCVGSPVTCQLTMDTTKAVTAEFALRAYELQITKAGTGAGTVTSTPVGIDCGSDCGQSYTHGTQVTLTASPTAGSTFGGWSGACSGAAATCSVSVDAAKSATATFALNTYPLAVQKAGAGAGTVTSAPVGIDCGSDCSESYAHGTAVTLTALPAAGSMFAGWSGAGCSGTGSCTVAVTEARAVAAAFNPTLVTPPPPPPPVVTCKVPALKGKTLAQAKSALTKANCALGKVTKAFSPKAKKGKVLKQSPAAGAVRAKGAKVALTLGKGPRR